MKLTGLLMTDSPTGEPLVSSQNHGFVQARLTTLFTIDPRFSTAVELSLDTAPFLDKLNQLGLKPDRELKPNICIYHADDFGFIDSFEGGEDPLRIQNMPLLAIEVLSPTQPENDIIPKIRAYFTIGVKSCWLVSPAMKIVTIYQSDGQCKAYDMQDGEIVDQVLEVRLKMGEIFYRRPAKHLESTVP